MFVFKHCSNIERNWPSVKKSYRKIVDIGLFCLVNERTVSTMFPAQLSHTVSHQCYRTSTQRLLQRVLRKFEDPGSPSRLRRRSNFEMILTRGPLCSCSGWWPPYLSRGVFNRQKMSRSSGVFSVPLTASCDATRKVRDFAGQSGAGCGMCEGKVKVEGLKSINRA